MPSASCLMLSDDAQKAAARVKKASRIGKKVVKKEAEPVAVVAEAAH